MSGNHSPEAVRALAFKLWRDRGGEGGSPEDDWFRAEQILSAEGAPELQKATEVLDKAVEDSFPASDPPAIHLNDEPPANAGAKWDAVKDKDARRKGSR